jgi:thiol-disulfide isomerase/thioredoxin
MIRILFLLFYSTSVLAQIQEGDWAGRLQLNDSIFLPVAFHSLGNKIIIINGKEEINVDEIIFNGDSAFIRMPVFDSEFRIRMSGDSLKGFFLNHARTSKNVFEFIARKADTRDRSGGKVFPLDISGRYHVVFDGEDDESKDAIGVFETNGTHATGTFLTTTGDYRYLSGKIENGKLFLSAFDGSHLFYFDAVIKGDSLINGNFYSGKHWHDTWHAVRDANYELRSADSLTKIISPDRKINFKFPDESGKLIELSDDQFKNKPVVIQIMGTWCPNCLDETVFLSEWYAEKKDSIELIALDYEKIPDFATASNNIKRLKQRLRINYPVLFAGSADKKEASKTLPVLDRIFAFPTTLFLDRNKNVVAIHTGFSGPGTGEEYQKLIRHFRELTESLLKN